MILYTVEKITNRNNRKLFTAINYKWHAQIHNLLLMTIMTERALYKTYNKIIRA